MAGKKGPIIILLALAGANVLIWLATLMTFKHFALLLGTASLAYTFGLRHALDADHISAIDNVTRKLIQDGKRPLAVGFFFSLGHSTIVVLLSVAIALTAARIQTHFPAMEHLGGIVGTSVSAFFLLAIAAVNLLILRNIFITFRRAKRGEPYDEQNVDEAMSQLGFLGRILRPIVRMVNRSWKMYFVGFLFGLGFDTATEIGLLGISAAAATQHLPIWSILLFPALFTAGMCLIDTADGLLMLGAYGWAYVHPIRKLYYNMTITAASVLIALLVGGIEALGVFNDQLHFHGPFWTQINFLGDHLGIAGGAIVALFVLTWLTSALAYRLLGYHRLELATEPADDGAAA
ncbi:MAG TPA: HoxN/HupN/NixA family nickel/cobalt transporter [Tepidisphaeraceae bacterium]|nr:HoxN/HupN/NixA family nickel/cobalt transporter [Tepidisphaeraceae bacterium]